MGFAVLLSVCRAAEPSFIVKRSVIGVRGRKMPERQEFCLCCGAKIWPPKLAYCSLACQRAYNRRITSIETHNKRVEEMECNQPHSLDGEVWKPIAGYEGEYEVSNLGRVRSLNYFRVTSDGKQYPIKSKVLKQSVRNGYHHIALARNGQYKRFRVHRLVADAFVANPDGKPHVNHIDCDKSNNCANNLEWVTPKENTSHALSHHLYKSDPSRMINARRKIVLRDDGAVYRSVTIAAKSACVGIRNMSYHIKQGTELTTNGHRYRFPSTNKERDEIMDTFFPNVEVKIVNPDATLPEYSHYGDAGMDLRSMEDVEIAPGETVVVGTGIAMAIPNGFVGMVFPRSGLGSRGLTLSNCCGIIDSGFRGEIKAPLHNNHPKFIVKDGELTDSGRTMKVAKGDRVVQILIVPVGNATISEVDELDETERGEGGFGSSGTH